MVSWGTLAKYAWESLKAPDPKSPTERIKRAWAKVQELGDACELTNELLKLTERDEETPCR